MSQLPGSPAYGLTLVDPPRDRSGPRPVFWLAVLGTFLAYVDGRLRRWLRPVRDRRDIGGGRGVAARPGAGGGPGQGANRIVIRAKSMVQR